jgi:hypothetical protein
MPVLEKSHAAPDAFVSIAGGYVVRDPALPDLAGKYVYADTYGGAIRAATLGVGGATADADTGLHVSTLASFGEDACGRVYAASLDGPVFRLTDGGACAGAPPAPTPAPTAGGGGAPRVKVIAAGRQRPWRSGVVRVRVSCDELCRVTAGGTFLITRAQPKAGTAVVTPLRTATHKTVLAANAPTTIMLKVSAKVRRSLLKSLTHHRRVTVRVAIVATDRDGNSARAAARSPIVRR